MSYGGRDEQYHSDDLENKCHSKYENISKCIIFICHAIYFHIQVRISRGKLRSVFCKAHIKNIFLSRFAFEIAKVSFQGCI